MFDLRCRILGMNVIIT